MPTSIREEEGGLHKTFIMEISTGNASNRTIVSRAAANKIQLDLRELALTGTDVVLLLPSTLVLIYYF